MRGLTYIFNFHRPVHCKYMHRCVFLLTGIFAHGKIANVATETTSKGYNPMPKSLKLYRITYAYPDDGERPEPDAILLKETRPDDVQLDAFMQAETDERPIDLNFDLTINDYKETEKGNYGRLGITIGSWDNLSEVNRHDSLIGNNSRPPHRYLVKYQLTPINTFIS